MADLARKKVANERVEAITRLCRLSVHPAQAVAVFDHLGCEHVKELPPLPKILHSDVDATKNMPFLGNITNEKSRRGIYVCARWLRNSYIQILFTDFWKNLKIWAFWRAHAFGLVAETGGARAL